jgi:hypothetical protein
LQLLESILRVKPACPLLRSVPAPIRSPSPFPIYCWGHKDIHLLMPH